MEKILYIPLFATCYSINVHSNFTFYGTTTNNKNCTPTPTITQNSRGGYNFQV